MSVYEVEITTTYYDVVRVEAPNVSEACVRALKADIPEGSGHSEVNVHKVRLVTEETAQ